MPSKERDQNNAWSTLPTLSHSFWLLSRAARPVEKLSVKIKYIEVSCMVLVLYRDICSSATRIRSTVPHITVPSSSCKRIGLISINSLTVSVLQAEGWPYNFVLYAVSSQLDLIAAWCFLAGPSLRATSLHLQPVYCSGSCWHLVLFIHLPVNFNLHWWLLLTMVIIVKFTKIVFAFLWFLLHLLTEFHSKERTALSSLFVYSITYIIVVNGCFSLG